MTTIPQIGEYMIPHPYTIRVEESLAAAEQVMSSHRSRHLPVVNNKKVVGLISDRDIAVAKSGYPDKASHGKIHARDICLMDPYVVTEDEPLDQVARTMGKRRLEAAVVVKDGIPVGIFTNTDACRFLAELLDSKHEATGLWTKFFHRHS